MKRQNLDALEAEALKRYEKKAKAKKPGMKVSGAKAKELARLIRKKGGAALALALFWSFGWSGLAAAQEAVTDYQVKAQVRTDGTVLMEETIEYDFADQARHGIFRDLPFKYRARGGNFELRLSDIAVTDTQGNPIPFTAARNGPDMRLTIGDPDSTVTGKRTYVIRYAIVRAVNFLPGHDELYWNAVGGAWTVPIAQVRAEVVLPAAVGDDVLKAECWAGPEGSPRDCVSKRYAYAGEGAVASVVFAHDRLDPGQGLTFAVGWPKGLVAEAGVWERAKETARDNGIVALPFATLALLLWLWRRWGRDPRGRGTVIAQYGPPPGLSPAEVGAAYDERVDDRDVSAEIIALAVAGFLAIERLSGQGIFNTADYRLIKTKEAEPGLPEHQRLLLAGLFKGRDEVKISELKEKFRPDWQAARSALYRQLVVKGIFAKSPRAVRGYYYAAGVVLLALSFAAAPVFGALGIASAAASGLAVILFARFMPARTRQGSVVREEIMGFREYLKVAEQDRIKFHNAPAKEPKAFERFLPYAMVLKVEEEWAKQFEGLYQAKPDWYRDGNYQTFNALALASHLNGFGAKSASALSAPPASAAGGQSGFSGGRAGGGFGGGGGGSW